jgi:hypothetical protein
LQRARQMPRLLPSRFSLRRSSASVPGAYLVVREERGFMLI